MKYLNLKFGLVLLVAAAVIMVVSTPINAVEVNLSGQINRALLYGDNGKDSELFFVDNDNSSTRIRVTGSEEVDGWGTFGFKGEWQFESNPSNEADIGAETGFGDNNFTERHMDIWLKSAYGKGSLGQGDMASNGTSEVDLSGTDVVTYSGVNDMGGGFTYLAPDGTKLPPVAGDPSTVGNTRSNFDGFGRQDRIRYDTTFLGPFTLSASLMGADQYDIAARYSAQLGGFGKLAAAAAVAFAKSERSKGEGDYDQFSSSASWLHGSGFNVTISYAKQDWNPSSHRDPDNIYVKLGYVKGKHAVSVQWSWTNDVQVKGDEADTFGAGYVYNVVKGIQLYAGGYIYGLDRSGVSSIDDVTTVMTGARVKF
jgi:hypothetical protein